MLMARGNREALLLALGHYRRALDELERLVRDQRWPELHELLRLCQTLRPGYLDKAWPGQARAAGPGASA